MRGSRSGLLAAVAAGTLLNPLNSAMIAVAVVDLQRDFAVTFRSASVLIAAFYAASAVGQPVMGRLADRLGRRRVFVGGLVVSGVASGLAAVAPAFGWLLVLRALQAVGTSALFPAGLGIVRTEIRTRQAAALGVVTVSSSISAAVGPTVGGALVSAFGWPSVFWINVPLALLALGLARALPPDGERATTGDDGTDADPRGIAGNRALLAVYAQFLLVSVIFYSVFFGVPSFLEQARGLSPAAAGLVMLPVAGLGVVMTPVAARLITRFGPRIAIVAGAAAMAAGAALLLTVTAGGSLAWTAIVLGIFGASGGFNNLGLQSALYAAVRAQDTSVAAGFFQTCRYLGAIAATVVLGAVFGHHIGSGELHELALVLTVLAAGAFALATRAR